MIFFIHNNKNDHQNHNGSPPSLFSLMILMGLFFLTNLVNEIYIEPNSIYSSIFYYLGLIEMVSIIIYAIIYLFYIISKK